MKADRTMGEIADTFLILAESMSPAKITINMIVDTCGKNRKTFYYHFPDKERLILWIFRRDLGECLLSSHSPEQLIYQAPFRKDIGHCILHTETYPYYIHNESGFCALDHSSFFRCVGKTIDRRRQLYSYLVKEDREELLPQHLSELYKPAFRDDAHFILGNRYLKPRNVVFLADFFSNAFISLLVQLIKDPSQTNITDVFEVQGNLIHDAMRHEIEEQRLLRSL